MTRFSDLFKKSCKLEKALQILEQCAQDGNLEAEKMLHLYDLLQNKKHTTPIQEQLGFLKEDLEVTKACQKIFFSERRKKAPTKKKPLRAKRARSPRKDS